MSQSHIIPVNQIKIWYETFGAKENPPVLLLMGNSCDATLWPKEFCELLAAGSFYVIRFDQRDTGLSTWIDFSKTPYSLLDMAHDAHALLHALSLPKAHLIGFSTGGSIAQLIALHYPESVLSLTLMMSSPDPTIKNRAFQGEKHKPGELPPPETAFIEAVLQINAQKPRNLTEKIAQLVENFRLANGKAAPFDSTFFAELFETSLKRTEGRAQKVGHESNHGLATAATHFPSLRILSTISAPTLVIGGKEDPIFTPPHSEILARTIPQADLILVDKMGHTLNPIFFHILATAIIDHLSKNRLPQKGSSHKK